jgi:flagellar FliL protein
MADQDRFLDEEESSGGQAEEPEGGKRVGFLPAIVLKVLKWVAIVVAILILVIVVVVITVKALVGESSAYTGAVPMSENVQPVPETLAFYSNLGQIRGQTNDSPPGSFVADIALGYELGNNTLATEISTRSTRIHNIILIYLSKKTMSDLHPKNAEKLQEELLREINRIMSSGKIKAVLINELSSFAG